jgi:hypothetical protein
MSHIERLSPVNPASAFPPMPKARFGIGDVVRHRLFDFRGVIFDVDPTFANSEEWYEAIPEDIRPSKDQPFYHLLRQPAEPDPGRERGADRPSGDRCLLRGVRRRALSAPSGAPALNYYGRTVRRPPGRAPFP